jgi:sulfur relay (sulfurtransferase) DsrC/TusE family protein
MPTQQNDGHEETVAAEKRSFSALPRYWETLDKLQDYWETDNQSQTLRRLLKYAEVHILMDEMPRSRRK